ncbi:hypothetical protein [Sphingobacterium corticibacterium]|uniref:Uncharacterized protein n=1 Tax=Sphingobacterium corticibacterium TaxID=2484746 RepID=A0A4V2DC03_9SPHI|nr:hypothetical protein [Sphingobacterium corticibacterium]RZF59788.1 hypothetical protein EWE74_11595 [Sphingobacterium corticibacterium]
MNKIIKKVSRAIQVVLLAPIKLPGKALQVLKYIAVGLGIIETVLNNEEDKPLETERKEDRDADDD